MKSQRGSQSRRGIALIIVMVAIFVLSVLIGAFAYSMKVETKLAMNANQESDLIWLGRSGVEFARWVLVQQTAVPGEPYDALNQKWAGGTGTLAASNSPLAAVSLQNYQIGDGTVSIRITDNERKFNINQANEQILQRVLTAVGVDAGEIPAITASIIDWIDPDDVTHVNGAESDHYESLVPPYSAKNRPMDDLSELLLVRGVTLDMYWGSASSNHIVAAFQPVDRWGRPMEAPVYPMGFVDVFTPLSNGRINVNTASAQTLQIIPLVDESGAAQIVQQRAGPDGVDGTEDDLPFRSPGEAGMIVNQAVAQQCTQFGTVRSSVFEVVVEATLGNYRKTFHATLARTPPRDVQILSFRWE
ncbi:MAG TPA: general secretion pathway protein GspK [Verrucomicrobiae bacterium]|nr:general secretion pathway protein GspK [Verrucomicrobiae bacterium]